MDAKLKHFEFIKCCQEIREWHKTGILTGSSLRLKAAEIEHRLGVSAGTAMQLAERNTADEAMDYAIAQSAKDGSDKALEAAVKALYFDDNSDYGTALWEVVSALSPKICELLEKDPNAAFDAVTSETKKNDSHESGELT